MSSLENESKEQEYISPFAHDPDYDFNDVFITEIDNYIKIHGYGHNQSCGWSNEKIFDMLDQMDLYDKKEQEIPDRKFYFVHNDDRTYKNLYKGGWASFIGHTIPTRSALRSLTEILRGKTVVSVGAGLGLWEHMLQNNGCKIICVDIEIWPFTYTHVEEIEFLLEKDLRSQLVEKNLLTKEEQIDVLFLGWPEPDRSCDCCPCDTSTLDNKDYRWYCNAGYDWDALKQTEPQVVIVLLDHGTDDFLSYVVCSKRCRKLLKKGYHREDEIYLPISSDNDYFPRIQVWRSKLSKDPNISFITRSRIPK